MRVAFFTILAIIALSSTRACAGTTVELSASSTNTDGEKHCYFDLRKIKHGLFLGICPSTTRLQWSYHFDLAGEGPTYQLGQMTVFDNIAADELSTNAHLKVASGSVVTDRSGNTVTINIQIVQNGLTNKFIGNGTYPFHE